MWTPTVCTFRLVKTESVAVDEIVEVEVAVSRPARPACASHAPQARSVAVETFSLVASHKAFAAARLPRSKAVGKAPTLIATHRQPTLSGAAKSLRTRHPCAGRRGQRHSSRAEMAYTEVQVHGGRSDYNTS